MLLMFSIFDVFKQRSVNRTMTSWRSSLNWSIYMYFVGYIGLCLHEQYFTNRGEVLTK